MNKQYDLPLLSVRSMYYTGLFLACAFVFQTSGNWSLTVLVWLATLQFYLFDRHTKGICLDIWWLIPLKVLLFSTVVIAGSVMLYINPEPHSLSIKFRLNAIGLAIELFTNLYVFRTKTFEKYGWTPTPD